MREEARIVFFVILRMLNGQMPVKNSYQIIITRTIPLGPLSSQLFTRAVAHVLRGEKKKSANISIIFFSDRDIRRINKKFLSHDYATDVITFPLETAPTLEAEIYIGAQTARRQAKEHHVPVQNELVRLTVHGVLHLCGYDDTNSRRAGVMNERENYYVERIFF